MNNKLLLIKVLIALSVKVGGGIAGFLAVVAITRSLGAEDAGIYFLAFSLVSLFAVIARVGLDGTVLRYTSSGEYNVSNVIYKSIAITCAMGLSVVLVIYTFSPFISEEIFGKSQLAPVLASMAPGVLGLGLIAVGAAGLQGLGNTAFSIFSLNIGVNLFLVAYLYFGNDDIGVSDVAHIFSLATFCVAFMTIIVLFFTGKGIDRDIIEWGSMFNSCIPLCVVLVVNQVVQWVGQFSVGMYLSSDNVAFLAAAQRTAMLSSFILMAINYVVTPKLSKFYRDGDVNEVVRLIYLSVRWGLIVSLPLVTFLMVFPDVVMGFFGEGFEVAAPLLMIFVIGQFVNVVTGPAVQMLMMSGYEKDVRTISLIVCTFVVPSSFLFTYLYGIVGSAVVTAASVILNNALAVYYVKVRLDIDILSRKLLRFR